VRQNTKDETNATHVYEFGMNPGLISHCVFKALKDISTEVLKQNPKGNEEIEALIK